MHRALPWAIVGWGAAVALAGCSSSSTSGGAPDAGLDATTIADAGLDANDATPGTDAGSDDAADDAEDAADAYCPPVAITGRVPASHRPAAIPCTTPRADGNAASLPSCDYDAGGAACAHDSDCTAGLNGRCVASSEIPNQSCPPPACTYDQCATDSDCGPAVPCDCRPASNTLVPNACGTGSNCAVDSDCGDAGYCSLGGYNDIVCDEPLYFCHTPLDTCLNDTDCCGQKCMFQYFPTGPGHFTCAPGCQEPP